MKQSDFAHLHVHSGYSLLDSMVRIDSLVERVKEHGQTACAITDHGTLAGVVKFTDACLRAGIKPILGQEFYIAPDSRHRKHYAKLETGEVDENGKPIKRESHSSSHLILLARTAKGWDNLRTLSTLAWTEGFYRKPRIDGELLSRYADGLICSTACMGGEISVHLHAGLDAEGEGKTEFNPNLATAKLAWYSSLFGNRFFIEIQEHSLDGITNQTQAALNAWYRERYPESMIYASADCHYISAEDYDIHDTLIASSSASHKNQLGRWRFTTDQCWLKSTEEMAELFSEREILNTKKIADLIEFELPLRKQFFMPELPPDILHNEPPEETFRRACITGLEERIGDFDERYSERLAYEMDTFIRAGFVEYALLLWDLISYCKHRGIFTGDGRGSGAGSLVLFALRITNVDPIERDCPFERFINPGRLENFAPPDVDLDFPQTRRQEVLSYLRERYGEDRVCQIGTYATLGVPGLVRKLAPVLGIPPGIVKQISDCIPSGESFQGKGPAGEIKGMSFDDVWRGSERFRHLITGLGETGKWLLWYGNALRELGDHASTHASGVIITNRPVLDVVPLMVAKANTSERLVLAQMDMFDVESLGLLKFDILGLKTLDVLATCQELIRRNEDPEFSFDSFGEEEFSDVRAYDLLARGHTIGIFQAEGEGFGRLLPQVKPSCVNDLAVLTSLCRPGPSLAGATASYIRRRQGTEPITYDIPELEGILGANYGVLTFQEDIMAIAHRLAGFTLAEADELRKVMGKKQRDKMPKYREKFIAGLDATSGISPFQGEKLWDQMAHMAEYVFNRSHAMAYSYTTLKCAWAKANYPAYFLAAAMTSEVSGSGGGKQLPTLVRDAQLADCSLQRPEINQSEQGFLALDRSTILLGFKGVRGIGDAAANGIVEERKRNGPFTSKEEFRRRMQSRIVTSATMTALSSAGAFRNLGEESSLGRGIDALQEEFRLFGFYLSSHPCSQNWDTWKEDSPDLVTLAELDEDYRKERVVVHARGGMRKQVWRFMERRVRCVITKVERKKSRRTGKFMQMLEIEDHTHGMKMIVNESALQRFGSPTLSKGLLLDLWCRKEDPDRGYAGYVAPSRLAIIPVV